MCQQLIYDRNEQKGFSYEIWRQCAFLFGYDILNLKNEQTKTNELILIDDSKHLIDSVIHYANVQHRIYLKRGWFFVHHIENTQVDHENHIE